MATSVHTEHFEPGNMIMTPGVAFDIEISECVISNSPVPKWVRQRLEESNSLESSSKTKSLDDIVTRLKEADLRRQQFHEWLAEKARPKRKVSPPHSPKAGDLAQRLEAKLSAAEQKRAELQAQEQMRLARIHELRMAAKTETQLRMEREREELGCKVESRVHQAELNRLALLELEKQRIAAAHERLAQSAVVRTNQEGKERERVEALRAAICQKIAAAEEKRTCLLEAEKSRAQATVLQARRVAQEVVRERELELKIKREKLEARLQRARGQRAEFLRKRGGCRGSSHIHGQKIKNGDRLCRKLTRCWRQFRQSGCTTYALAQDYAACGLSKRSVTSISFEQLASRITSTITLRTVKALLARIESRLKLSLECQGGNMTSIDHLLKRLAPPARKPRGQPAARKLQKTTGESVKKPLLERYPMRVFLCAYMILGQPEAVFSSRGDREAALADTAAKLLPQFEALTGIILDGPGSSSSPASPSNSPSKMQSWPSEVSTTSRLPSPRPFAAQLAAFDAAWCAYLYQFVAWKVKDAKLLEEDMTRMACQFEVSMLQKCRVPDEDLSHDAKAIRVQVLEDQKLLRDRIFNLTGTAGLARMEEALRDARLKFAEAAESGSPLPSPFRTPELPSSSSPEASPSPSESEGIIRVSPGKPKVVRSLFKFPAPAAPPPAPPAALPAAPPAASPAAPSVAPPAASPAAPSVAPPAASPAAPSVAPPASTPTPPPAAENREPKQSTQLGSELTNEHIVNEMFHDAKWSSQETGKVTEYLSTTKANDMQSKVRSAMENAFWDNIASGLAQQPTDYKRVVDLVGEVREELEALVPEAWKDELRECMDLELISQILDSGSNDVEYLRRLLDYASGLILKLGSPARDSPAKAAHESLVKELSASVPSDTFFTTLVKGLRFIFEQLQVLKQDISVTRLRAIAPIIGGTVGVDYLRSAFSSRHQITTSPSFADVSQRLPNTVTWFTDALKTLQHEKLELETSLAPVQATPTSAAIPTMRTGGRLGVSKAPSAGPSTLPSVEKKFSEVQWTSNETLVRLGLLQILRSNEGANAESIAETLALNTARLHGYQNAYQQILVIATGLLIARQGLVSQGMTGPHLEATIESGKQKLELLLNDPAASLTQIGAVLAEIANNQIAMSSELMTRVLRKSLSPDDPVFARVSSTVGAAFRALLVLGTTSSQATAVAHASLKKIGGLYLVEKLAATAASLEVVAEVTCRVHAPWYSSISEEIL